MSLVHADGNRCPRPRFPQDQNAVRSCAQTAIIPTNSAIDVKAAASSTKIRNITISRIQNIEGTMFLFCSEFKRPQRTDLRLRRQWLTAACPKKKAPAEAGAFRSAVKLGSVAGDD